MNDQRSHRQQLLDSGLEVSHRLVDVLASSAIIGTAVTTSGAAVVGIVYVAGFPASEWFRNVTVTVAALAAGFLFVTVCAVAAYYLLYTIRGEHSHGGILDGE
ncbi:hypothetical protein [Halopiger xanaduensis]|uniref:Uncharacterized protein n=1 Tax=Halopiger xanaduensis (strain DSM 18323 / JCM 14033 / SH-6) TaxID=797210 RepID=F8DB23_HALXS|nr:hypothetical protein [Halopiger xanaduensis]AEH38273.1 hypothetical protein Halxa_3665 [Halopiger xanaduensis SH-6]